MKKLVRLLVICTLFIPFTSAISVGVSPGFIDLGEVDPGSTQEIDFYITTNSEEPFDVKPKYDLTTTYASGDGSDIPMRNVSEQNISSWIEFSQETYNIDPSTEQTYDLPDGSSVSAEGVITMNINIPSNVEPGYRMGQIELEPGISGEGNEAGARVLAQTVPGFAFRLPGNVERNIEFSDLQAVRVGQQQVQIIGQFRNRGTVTTNFRGGEVEVRDSQNRLLDNIYFGSANLEPGEFAEIDTTWISDEIDGGEYSIEGKGDYRTGETYISGEFAITDTIQERQNVDEPSGGVAEEAESEAPLVMIIIISILLGTILYILDIELTWIGILTGGLMISLYILLGPVSNVMVLIPLISLAVILYA